MKQSLFKLCLIVVIFITSGIRSSCQSDPEEYKKGTISEQMSSLEAHTRIYENFRAIREDIFQLLKKNINDTVSGAKRKINILTSEIAALNVRMDSLNKSLESTKVSLEDITRTKNSISVLGIEVNKTAYNSLMWSILGILVLLLVTGYLIFKMNRNTTHKSKKELADLQKEYEDYKQRKRIENEKMIMSHFNEMKKLKEEFSKSKR